jgi:hypothetical protein
MTDDGWRHRLKLLGADNLNTLDRWRMDSAQRELSRAQAREQRKREQERHERQIARASASEQIATLHAELATLRAAHEDLQGIVRDTLNATSEALLTLGNTLHTQHNDLAELKLVITRLGASSEAKRGFQFARDKSDVEPTDLPDFLTHKVMN